MSTLPIKYIDGQPKNGVKYDWKAIRKLYKKLKIPDEYFNPTKLPLESAKYFPVFSMRSVGKTTNVLLLGMCMNALYGTQIIYIRQFEDMIMPKATKDLLSVIIDPEFDYVNILTGGRYNGVCYKSRRWYYCNYGEDGKIAEVSPEHFLFMCSVDRAVNLKSSANFPLGDLLVFDEFVNQNVYTVDEFVNFCDLVKTIIRSRLSPIIFMLANTIDRESPYYHEMEIYDEVNAMLPGDNITKTTVDGTVINITYVSPSQQTKSALERLNSLFFGFQNKRLGSITGKDWSIKPKPHIPKSTSEEVFYILNNLYVKSHEKYVRLDIVQHVDLGVCCYVHWASKTYDDSIILTTEAITDKRYYYGLGPHNLQALLAKLIAANKMYYASNDVAAFLAHYINSIPNTIG